MINDQEKAKGFFGKLKAWYNAPDKDEAQNRVMFIQQELGNKKASYVMAMLMLPFLMDIVERSEEYKEYFDKHKKKTLN